MKLVFICNKEYKDKITLSASGKGFDFCGVHISFEREHEKSAEEWKENTLFITSADEIGLNEINSHFSAGDFCQNQMFVMPELLWKDRSVDEGYEIVCKLFEKLKDKQTNKVKPVMLHFVSNFTQTQLRNMVDTKYQAMVDALPHICINQIEGGKWNNKFVLKLEAYSETHFNLILHIAVDKLGRLDYIEHQLRNDPSDLTEKKKHFLKWIDALDDDTFPLGGLKDSIKNLKGMVNAKCPHDSEDYEAVEDYVNSIIGEIVALINKIRIHLPQKGKGTTIGNTTKDSFDVLIIDDNKDQREKLCNFFKEHYNVVECNDNGRTFSLSNVDKAKAWLKLHAEEYHIIILDLLFMQPDSDTWLSYNGFDLLEAIPPYCTVRIITSLPRQTVSNICNHNIRPGQIITKSKGWQQLEGCLYDKLEGINKECKKNLNKYKKEKNIRMPRVGFFGEAPVISYCENKTEEELNTLFEEAKSLIGPDTQNIKIPLGKKGNIDPNIIGDPKFDFDGLFRNYLAHRLAFLQYVLSFKGANPVDGVNFSLYKGYAEEHHVTIQIDNKYFTRIGYKTEKNKVFFTIYDMFPAEWKFFADEYRKTRPSELSEEASEWALLIGWTFQNNKDINQRQKYIAFHEAMKGNGPSYDEINDLLHECNNAATVIESIKEDLKKLLGFSIDYEKLESDSNLSEIIQLIKETVSMP